VKGTKIVHRKKHSNAAESDYEVSLAADSKPADKKPKAPAELKSIPQKKQ
jgi:hypothetical protein